MCLPPVTKFAQVTWYKHPHYLGRGRHKSLQRGNMSGKTSSPQGSCSPAHSQACSFSRNKASPLSESTQHSCQDHKYNEVPSKASSRQDSCKREKSCQLLAVLSLICSVWHTVCSVEIVARRRVRLPSCVLFFGERFCVSLVDLGKTRR